MVKSKSIWSDPQFYIQLVYRAPLCITLKIRIWVSCNIITTTIRIRNGFARLRDPNEQLNPKLTVSKQTFLVERSAPHCSASDISNFAGNWALAQPPAPRFYNQQKYSIVSLFEPIRRVFISASVPLIFRNKMSAIGQGILVGWSQGSSPSFQWKLTMTFQHRSETNTPLNITAFAGVVVYVCLISRNGIWEETMFWLILQFTSSGNLPVYIIEFPERRKIQRAFFTTTSVPKTTSNELPGSGRRKKEE